MWVYEQIAGRLSLDGGNVIATGYSGAGEGKNNPTEENVRDEGPIPEGIYYIQAPENTHTHGPFVLRLMPDVDNVMFGRAGFLIHGDSIERPGQASEGCIIMPLFARRAIWDSGEHTLRVVKELPTRT
jgi:hypothetical protein